MEVAKHPDSDKLYVEKIDLGEPTPRTIVSGTAILNSTPNTTRVFFIVARGRFLKKTVIFAPLCTASPKSVMVATNSAPNFDLVDFFSS